MESISHRILSNPRIMERISQYNNNPRYNSNERYIIENLPSLYCVPASMRFIQYCQYNGDIYDCQIHVQGRYNDLNYLEPWIEPLENPNGTFGFIKG
jgi:hypothetical protein